MTEQQKQDTTTPSVIVTGKDDKLIRPKNLNEVSMACRQNLVNIDSERANPLPTPPAFTGVGWVPNFDTLKDGRIQWFIGIVQPNPVAPGRVDVFVHHPQYNGMYKAGATYIRHPEDLKSPKVRIGTNGAWFYADVLKNPDYKPPKGQFQWHLERLDEREQRCLQDEIRRQKDEAQRLALKAEREQLQRQREAEAGIR